ncbi:hypothetical protein BDY19DRAFT_929224 [Irpex rosettiformis]|uniref:Uncharacterized protein n=2 Tax=Irpex rosettiformis TaxID=378272 RepID=A0ACB8UDD7_9APHY|nr:hypothetical protein BDY19DRAFT_981672 [Irpex rosettiformis]KAI0092266.1 hypothetical protein BDY19DRAFT_929224 [Irpex rosettiformis]
MTPTRNSGSTSILFTPRKRQAVAEAVTHLRQANAASLTHFTSQSPSSARLPTVPFIQIPPTPEKARRLLRAPLDRFAGYEDVVKENNELRAQLEGMRSMLDGARRIVEGSNAELAITQLGYSQMARKLYWKKKSKSIKNRLLSTKVGRYITSDRFREVVAEEAKARKVKEKEKTAREQRWKLRKEATVWRKAATQRKKERRKRELALYEKARSDAQRQGNRLPTKPKAPPREPTPERFRVVGTMEEGEQNIEDEAEDEAEIDTDDDDADLDLEDGL